MDDQTMGWLVTSLIIILILPVVFLAIMFIITWLKKQQLFRTVKSHKNLTKKIPYFELFDFKCLGFFNNKNDARKIKLGSKLFMSSVGNTVFSRKKFDDAMNELLGYSILKQELSKEELSRFESYKQIQRLSLLVLNLYFLLFVTIFVLLTIFLITNRMIS
jgi:hypothetical protein